MADEIVLVDSAEAALERVLFTRDQVELIKRTYCAGATDDELEMFLATCKRLGLSPLLNQIHFVKRWDGAQGREVGRAQTAIDGFRLVAERTGRYLGQTKPEWCDWNGQWYDIWLFDEPPAGARVGVWKTGNKEPVVRVATLNSYCQRKKDGSPTKMWRQMPDVMLLKCAEAQALRVAFPAELGGVYTSDEMGQADDGGAPVVERKVTREKPSNVVELPRRDNDAGGIVEMFRGKLHSLRKFDELVSWCLEVQRANFPVEGRKVLWKMAQSHATRCGYDPLELGNRVSAESAAPTAK